MECIGRGQETKSSSQRPTGSRHRPARRPTFQSLQSHQSLPSRSYRRWYPWLQSNARALLNYTDQEAGRPSIAAATRGWDIGERQVVSQFDFTQHASVSRLSIRHGWRPPATVGSAEGGGHCEHAHRVFREFVSKKVIPGGLSISPQPFAATLEAMRRSGLIKDHPQSEVQACVDLRFLDATDP
jgi:hypothetical protein